MRWTPPNNEGSQITSYEIKEAGSGRTWQASGGETSKVIAGLTNGTSYAFEIRAINEVEPRREFSGASKAVAPFGVPMRSGVAPSLVASEADKLHRAALRAHHLVEVVGLAEQRQPGHWLRHQVQRLRAVDVQRPRLGHLEGSSTPVPASARARR
ncbi:fibronectin type III domain-containing protein [Nocardioides sp. W3-2-3]|nr:fibronectin type III domain-containing protein [Nocardioides convexus]